MKMVLRRITATALAMLLLHSNAHSTFAVHTITKHQIPYVEQAIANMRDGIEAKKKVKKTVQKTSRTQTANQVIHLTQKDFDSGTYRIRTPNTTVILDTNIEFEPIPSAEATRSDKPITGWFAAITVETDNVVIDLNGKTLQASEFFLAADAENIFADIELDNAPFSGILFGVLGAFFPGDTEFVSANNVVIKNGVLGRSDHWGIHGNVNSNITIEDVHVKDFVVAGIELNGAINSTIRNVTITGLEHIIRTNFNGVAASTLANFLLQLANTPDEPCFAGAAEQLASLLAYVDANPQIFNTPLLLPQGAFTGISTASGFLNFTFFPSDPAACDFAALLAGGRNVDHLTIENVSVSGLSNAPQESVLIASQANGQLLNLPLLGIPVFGAMAWDSAFDPEGNFAPTPFLLAQVFVANTQLCLFPDIISQILPPNWAAISDSINTGNEQEFLNNVFPAFGIALDSVPIKGTFGLRYDCSNNGILKNIKVSDIHNLGKPGQTLATIPDGLFYVGLVQEERYKGNDCWGYEFGTLIDAQIKCCDASNISSLNGGEILGMDLITNSERTAVSNCTASCVVGFADDIHSIVNPPATAYGFRVENNSGPTELIRSKTNKITAPRFSFGFAAEHTHGVEFNRCTAENITATSSKDLNFPKQAFGFDLQDAHDTVLKCVTAKNIAIKGEANATESASVAAGIGIDNESAGTTIICPSISCIKGGAGIARKIFDQGQNTIVKKDKNCKKLCKD